MLLKLIPDNTKIPFTAWRQIAISLSAIMVIGSIIAVATLGLNFGVDFKGGVTIEVVDNEPVDLGSVRSTIGGLGLGEVNVTEIQDIGGAEKGILVTGVEEGSKGYEANMRRGDLIKEINRNPVSDLRDFRKILADISKGDPVRFLIKRMNAGYVVVRLTK